MRKHTEEPWEVERRERRLNAAIRGDVIYGLVANEAPTRHIGVAHTQADAERIVACVNACKGVNPEAVPLLIELAKQIILEDDQDTRGDKIPADIVDGAHDALRAATEGL